ncbi:MAG TPA: hypothetical protein VHV47_03965 [Opitutaceae bacterium]|jgi:hypothetical protein|nr:hypothetical protein [Opitutaceae bacterium]
MYILTYIALSLLVGYIGKDRKFGFWGYFACAFVLTPIIGLVVVLASDKKAIAA